jgi:malonate-semialdehyde dehydrogenase (acetylating)/methylmalonate-semialdehyde dehydrogenase
VTLVPQATKHELEYAAKSAAHAFKSWRKTTVLTRQKVMLDLQALIRQHMACIRA